MAKQIKYRPPVGQRPKTFVPVEPPKMMPILTQQQFDAMQQAMMYGTGMAQAQMNVEKEVRKITRTIAEKVHPSYVKSKTEDCWVNEDGLKISSVEVADSRELPGFYLVHKDDPYALYKVGDYWYTLAEGEKSLEILLKSLEPKRGMMGVEKIVEDEYVFASGLNGAFRVSQQQVPTQHQWAKKLVPRPGAVFIDEGVDYGK